MLTDRLEPGWCTTWTCLTTTYRLDHPWFLVCPAGLMDGRRFVAPPAMRLPLR